MGSDSAEGLILVDGQSRYTGFLSATALSATALPWVINDKNLTLARDQNPLSRLPCYTHTLIHEYLSEWLADVSVEHVMVYYYDFDNFKPFNNHYGFRQGDRIADIHDGGATIHASDPPDGEAVRPACQACRCRAVPPTAAACRGWRARRIRPRL